MGVALGDYLHTGRFGIFVSNFADEYDMLCRQDKPLLFTDVSFASGIAKYRGPWVGWGTAFFDYDNDGWPDILVVNGHVYPQIDNLEVGSKYAQRILLFHNNADGTFSEVAAQTGDALLVPRISRGAAFGDLFNDGHIDVVINNLDGKPTILRNVRGNPENNWLTLKLVGIGKNPDALGARAKVISGDLVQWDEVRSGGSYLSSSDMRLHFGLSKRTQVDLIEVHWPDDKVETLKNVPINDFVTIKYGKGIVNVSQPKSAPISPRKN